MCGETPDPQTTGDAVAPRPLSRDVTVAAVLHPGTSRSQRSLLSPPVLTLRLQEEPGSGVPRGFSGSKVPQTTQGSCSSLCWSLRPRLTLTVQAGTAGLLTETQGDGNWDETSACQGLVLRELSNFR